MILIFFIGLIILGLSFYPIYLLLKKINFDLKGYEIGIYQLANLLIFHTGQYYYFNFYQELIALYLLMILVFYHIVKMIKTKKYIPITTLLLYLVSTIGNGVSLYFVPYKGWDDLGYILLSIIIGIITMLFVLLINLITLIIRNIKQIIKEKDNNIFNNPLKIIILVVFVISPFIYGYLGKSLDTYLQDIKKDNVKNFAIKYLNKKYGDGNYIVKNIEENGGCSFFSCDDEVFDIEISSSYFKTNFNISVTKETLEISNDEFILKYFEEFYNKKFYDYYDIEEYLKEEIKESLKNNDYTIIVDGASFNEEKFKNKNFGHYPLINEIMEYMSFNDVSINIHKIYKKEDLELFKNDIVKIYEIIKNNNIVISESKSIFFTFDYNNPFNDKNIHYNDGGYIKDVGSLYHIYVIPTPYEVIKKDKELLLEIYSNRMYCETVKLRFFNNDTYEYIYDTNKLGYKTGTYNYDLTKLINNIDKYNKENIGPYIINYNNKKYEIYDTSKELKELLSSIKIELDKCISYSNS